MTIQQHRTPIFESDNPDFNQRAAQQAYEIVMKMDRDTAEMYTTIVVSDYFETLLSKNLPMVQRHLNEVVAKRIEEVKRATARAGVSKLHDPEAEEFAKALVEIEKAKDKKTKYNPNKGPQHYPGYQWKESDYNRDPGSGQFRAKITHNQNKPIPNKTARHILGTATPTHDKDEKKLDPARRAKFQDEYRQLSHFLQTVNASSDNPGDQEVLLHFQDGNGNNYTDKHVGTMPNKAKLLDPDMTLMGVSARPNNLNLGGVGFGLHTALGGDGTSETAARNVHMANQAEAGAKAFKDEWLKPNSSNMNSNEQTYRRLAGAGSYLGSVAPDGSKMQMAANFAEIVGNAGPEAERVIGPTARKTAYRYRGTERTPESHIVNRYARAISTAKGREVGDDSSRAGFVPTKYRRGGEPPPVPSVGQMADAREEQEGRPPTWEERAGGRTAIMEELEFKLPAPGLYDLQLASGNTPPSEGIMLNRDGQIVAQASGYGDDHYIPFNLKNLKGLKGGEYIRTRSVGGLTSEDIYVGLVSGARRVTVVSRSGRFSIEFEPDFRGGRRYNDKAARMTRRYEQILDAVQSKKVSSTTLPPPIRSAIVQRVREETVGEDIGTVNEMIETAVKEYKENPEISAQDQDIIDRMYYARTKGVSDPDAVKYMAEVTNMVKANKGFMYQLDGPGYQAAAKALEEQFPYYIKSISRITPENDIQNLETDRGYVEPGRNRPTAARAGLYGTVKGQDNKFSAALADYQTDYAAKKGKNTEVDEGKEKEEEEKNEDGTPKTTPKTTDNGLDGEDLAAEANRKRSHANSSLKLYELMKGPGGINQANQIRMLKMDPGEFMGAVQTPNGTKEFKALVDLISKDYANLPDHFKTAIDEYNLTAGDAGTVGWSPELGVTWPRHPMKFTEPAYKKNAPPAMRAKAIREINSRTKPLTKPRGTYMGQLKETDLEREVAAYSDILRAVTDHPELRESVKTNKKAIKERRKFLKGILGREDFNEDAIKVLMKDPKLITEHLKDVHRMRYLMKDTPDDQRGVPNQVHVGNSSTNSIEDEEGKEVYKKIIEQNAPNVRDEVNKIPLSDWDKDLPVNSELMSALNEAEKMINQPDQFKTKNQWEQAHNHLRDAEAAWRKHHGK